jgi:hypothetical protein
MVEMRGVLDLEMIRGNDDEDGVGRGIECFRRHLDELDDRQCESWLRQRIHNTATSRSFGTITSIENEYAAGLG